MNRSSIAKRITQAAEDSKRLGANEPIIKCWLSNGTVEYMPVLTAMTYNRGELIDNEVIFADPYIKRAECIDEARAAENKLISVCLQMINKARG